MIKVSSQADKVCVAKVHEASQEHVFAQWDALSNDERKALLAQLQHVDFQLMKRLVQQHLHSQDANTELVLNAPDASSVPRPDEDREEFELCRTLGEYALRNGEVSLVTASGSAGEGPTSEPVGLMPVGPVTGKSVFQLHAEKVRALNRRHKVSTRWYIFCHPDALDATAGYFKEHSYFGLNCSDIHFHAQDVLPVVNRRGKLLLSEPGKLCMHTKGEGDILVQLLSDEFLQIFEKQNIKYVYYFQADNALVKIGDLVFLGNHIKNEADMSSKCVRKSDPKEDLGVFGRTNGSHRVIPRSELGEEERERRCEDGSLVFGGGNIGNHIVSIRFLEELRAKNFELPYHRSECATPHIAKNGRLVRPTEPSCVHFQTFIADALAETKRAPLMEVGRNEEFSPIRNTAGKDSPQTAQRDLSQLYASWLRDACANVELNGDKEFVRTVEISPLYAIDADELKEKIELPVDLTSDILL